MKRISVESQIVTRYGIIAAPLEKKLCLWLMRT